MPRPNVPDVFRVSANRPLASYDFFDIAQGTAIAVLYGGKTGGASGAHVLSPEKFYSEKVETYISAGTNEEQKVLDLDFNLTANLPIVIGGPAIVNVPFGVKASVGNNNHMMYIYAKFRKYDGTTETEIASASGALILKFLASAGNYAYHIGAVPLTIPVTHFKKGEIIRITTEMYAWQNNNNTGTWFIGHDPQSRTDTPYDSTITWGTAETEFSFQLPVRIAL